MSQYVMFWKPTQNNGFLSQWYPSNFTENGIMYCCAEQYMMAKKAELFGDNVMLQKILKTTSPKYMKMYGRKVRNFDEEVWNRESNNIVYKGNTLKFQDEELKSMLLSFGSSATFVEASPYDRIWGIGYTEDKALRNRSKWGNNLLGKILTRVRDDIISLDPHS